MDDAPTNALRGTPLVPSPTLREVLGEGVAYVPRRSPSMPGWASTARGPLDFLTGNQLAVAGGVPYVASTGVVTRPALDLLAEAGLTVDAELHPYRSLAEHPAVLRRLIDRGLRLSLQRVHPASEAPAAHCTVRPALLAMLNDKGHLGDFVPAAWLPRRRIVRVDRLPPAKKLLADGPVVLKAASALPSGGGHGVWIVASEEEVDDARRALAVERLAVVEEFLPIARSVCVHAAVRADGSVVACGTAEEVCERGKWLGNWLDPAGDDLPADALAAAMGVVTAAAARGYRGLAGVDVALLSDGRPPKILDLNFRVNGSTAAAWLRASLERERGARSIRVRSWTVEGAAFADLLRVARGAVARGTLVPLCLYDPDATATSGVPRMSGLLVGPTREAVEEEQRRLESEGLR
jgi:hypothetical protein